MQKIAILYDASQAVLSTFDLDEVLNQMLAILRDYFHLRNGAVLLVDRETDCLFVRAQMTTYPPRGQSHIPIGQGITGAAARLKRPIYAPDVRNDSRYIEGDTDTRSELAVPLIVKDQVVGVMDCQSEQVDAFDHETVDLLTLFATNAAIALQNTELYAREQRRASQLEAINRIAKQLTGVLDLDQLLERFCDEVPQSFAVDHVSVCLFDNEGHLSLHKEKGQLVSRYKVGDRIALEPAYTETALTTGETILANELSTGLGFCEGTRSEACLPLIAFGNKVGLLICSSASPNAFKSEDVPPLESISDILATAVQNAGYVEKIRMQANVDGLTGIYNRRYFETHIAEKMSEATRYGGGLAIIMIDIDRFKSLNDEFGHLLGDEVLRSIAKLMSDNLRKVDSLCRYGGEEFVIVAPATTGQNAVVLADKLRRAIETYNFPGVPRPVTVSIGVADFPLHGGDRDSLVRAADEALYRAKQGGRNRVEMAGAPQPVA